MQSLFTRVGTKEVNMRSKFSYIFFILSIPLILLAAFVFFWISLALAALEWVVTIPLSWYEVADGKLLDEYQSPENNNANIKLVSSNIKNG